MLVPFVRLSPNHRPDAMSVKFRKVGLSPTIHVSLLPSLMRGMPGAGAYFPRSVSVTELAAIHLQGYSCFAFAVY